MLRLGSPRRVKFRGQKLNLRIWRNRQFARERCLRQIQRAGQRRSGRNFFGAPSRKKLRQPQELRGRGYPINLIFADMAE